MKIATTKERLLQYIENKEISVTKFLAETSIKRGFLDTDKLHSAVSDVFLATIIATYPDLDLHWLITGKGQMLTEIQSNIEIASEPVPLYNTKDELIEMQREVIVMQREKLAELERKLGKGKEEGKTG